MDDDDKKIIGAITAATTAVGAGIVPITITSAAPGILGVIGFTTTTTVALPVAGLVAVGGGIGFGLWKAYNHFNGSGDDKSLPPV